MATNGRILRLLRLLTALQSGRARHAADLQQELVISRRTLFRDLKMLQSAGVPVYYDPDAGYQVRRNFFLPAVNLTVAETLGLLLLAKTTTAQTKRPYVGHALSAINKLIVTVPDPIRRACADMLANVTVDPGAQCISEAEDQYYPVLQQCIDEKRRCEIEYKSPTERQPFRSRFDVYALHYGVRAWYALGYLEKFKQVRMIKLARIMKLEMTSYVFARPRRFKVTDKLGKAWQLNPEGKIYKVELLFQAKVATNVSEVHWHASQKHKILKDGKCRMVFEVDGLQEIAWWICGYANQVKVLSPPTLRVLVNKMLSEASEQYSPNSKNMR